MAKSTKHILVIKHGALGDLMQSVGIMMDIRKHYPDSVLTLLTTAPYLKLMQRCPYIDHVIVDARAPIWRIDQQIKLKKQLQKVVIDLVIDLQNSDRSRMYQQFWFSEIEWIGRSAEENEPASGLSGLIALLQDAGIPTEYSYQPELNWMIEDVSTILNKQVNSQKYIALIPGSSSQHLEKRWPHFATLATALIEQGKEVVVILGPDEVSLSKQMPGYIMQGLTWFQLAGVLDSAKFIIGNDTGPSHIASYLGKAGLAIFGPTTSASRSEIRRGQFQTLEVSNLAALSVDQVLNKISIVI